MSAALEQLVVLAVREFQQARVSLEQAAVMLDMVRATLDPDAQNRVHDLTVGGPGVPGEADGDTGEETTGWQVCPECGDTLAAIQVFGGTSFMCPTHGEIAVAD